MRYLTLTLALLLCTTIFAEQYPYAKAGPFETVTEAVEIGHGKYTIFRPKDLGIYKEKPIVHPVLTWGNGTFARPHLYEEFLTHMASWGFVVIASDCMMTGSGRQMLDGAKWLLEQNEDEESLYHRKLSKKVGTFGHSQGAEGAIKLGDEEIVATTVAIFPAFKGKEVEKVKGPILLLAADHDFWVEDGEVEAIYNRTKANAVYGMKKGAIHISITGDATEDLRHYITVWFLGHLTPTDSSPYFGANGRFFSDGEWEAKKNH